MKHLLTILLFSVFNACSVKTDTKPAIQAKEKILNLETTMALQEITKRNFFNEHIANRNCNDGSCRGDSTTDFKRFMKIYYPFQKAINILDPLVYGLEEPYIDSNNFDKSKQLVRFIVDGTWSIPYCIIAEKKNRKTYITFKTTDGSGGYFPGTLETAETMTFSDSIYEKLIVDLEKLNFWMLKHDYSNYCTTDGTIFTFEAMNNGKYNLVNFYSPYSCGDSISKKLESINFWLQSFIDVEKAYNVRVKKKSGG